MWTERLICAECSEGLNPMMRVCPKCGIALEGTRAGASATSRAAAGAPTSPAPEQADKITEPASPTSPSEQISPPPPEREKHQPRPLFIPASREPLNTKTIPLVPSEDFVYLSPQEAVPRFPRFTQPQLMLMAAGAGLVIFLGIVALLLWNRHEHEQERLAQIQAMERAILQPSPMPVPTIEPLLNPTPLPLDDKALADAVKAALTAYNPVGAATRYKFQVKDGIVTLDGFVFNQPEKTGAENVLRAIAGIRMLCSNLVLSTEPLPPVMAKINDAEAKRLDAALLKQLLEDQKGNPSSLPPSDAPLPSAPAQPDPQREVERQRREQELARLREEEAGLRKQAEEKLQRDAAEYERRQEEQRRAEADRRARAEQSRVESSVLRSGTVAWSGMVDGVDEIVISGSSASVRHLSGESAREARASFSAAIPRAPVNIKLIAVNGRGAITLVQEPAATNGYTTIVRVDDSSKGGEKRYEFTLRWSAQ